MSDDDNGESKKKKTSDEEPKPSPPPPIPSSSKKRRVSRRGLIVGAGFGVVAAGAEWLSLRGNFDHRRPPDANAAGADRYAASLRQIEAGGAVADGIIHVAHSTHLLALAGMRLLTDPWFYDPAFGALSHEAAPAVPPSAIGKLDAILITHDHADHADLRAMDEMEKSAIVIVATQALAAKVRARGFGDVSVLAPWEERKLGSDVIVTAVPALHDVYEVGYVVRAQGPKCVYFAGDTRLHPDLPAIAERFKPTTAILPVDGTRLTGGALHVMTPDDALVAARSLGVKLVVPSHAEAFFSDLLAKHLLASTIPRARFRFAELIAQDLPGTACKVPVPGELIALA